MKIFAKIRISIHYKDFILLNVQPAPVLLFGTGIAIIPVE